jgi:DNA (cytosine-5)-methyltransferase 1
VKILDGCCGAGGASRGYVDAGHEVWGTDIAPQPNYLRGSGAAGFLRADILDVLREPWISNVDFIHVSPPCQRGSRMTSCRPGLAAAYPDLVGEIRELLIATGKAFVIEQPEHGTPLRDPVTLCGWMFGYETYRHRCFEAGGGFTLAEPPRPPGESHVPSRYRIGECGRLARAVGALTGWEVVETEDPYYGWVGHVLARLPDGRLLDAEGLFDSAVFPPVCPAGECECEACAGWDEPDVRQEAIGLLNAVLPRNRACSWPHPVPAARAGHWEPSKFVSVAGHERVALTRKVMAIDWCNREELAEAIPPYFTRWIGEQLSGPLIGSGPGDRRATPAERQNQ